MKCEHCGFEQALGHFCDQCGRHLARVLTHPPADEAPQEPRRCSSCGREQAQGRFCDACGLDLGPVHPTVPETAKPEESGPLRCPTCGLPSSASICRNCGNKIPGFVGE